MKTFGDITTQTLVSLIETSPYGFPEPGYHVTQLCPPGKYPLADDRAPWNKPDADPDATTYLDEDGTPILWTPPVLVPLVKLPQPQFDPATQTVEPTLVWSEDKVERDWTIRDLTAGELTLRARKVWATSARYLTEFSLQEMAAISLSPDPTIAALRLLMASWDGEVWSDDPRVIAGLDALEANQIIDATRRAEIIAKS
jgi:hypothetical protein